MDPTKKEDRTMAHLGTWDPEAISYDQEHNLLVVSGSVSGTVAVFEVTGWNCFVKTGHEMMLTDRLPMWNRPEQQECTFEQSWSDLAEQRNKTTFSTGGLGPLQSGVSNKGPLYQVWLCVEQHGCARKFGGDDNYCFVYDEMDTKFVPWGANTELNLVGGNMRRLF
ncbi:hypothetical protein T484DRAFT_1884549 [Baffinella frigidus]|nr:hypothetical protein T484DRAFT_1884549 [Cryptophyta sp. CCMP2293]